MEERKKILIAIQYILQIIALVVGFRLAYLTFTIIEGRLPFSMGSSIGFLTAAGLPTTWGIIFVLRHNLAPEVMSTMRNHINYYVKSSIISLLFYSSMSFLFKFISLSRLMALTYMMIMLLLFMIILIGTKIALRMVHTRHYGLLVMDNIEEQQVARIIEEINLANIQLCGIIAPTVVHTKYPYIGPLQGFSDYLESTTIDSVLIHPSIDRMQIDRCVYECQMRGIPSELLIGHYDLQAATKEVIQTPYGTSIRLMPHKTNLLSLSLKRLTDIIISSVALIIFSPILLAIMIIIKLTSEGPVFFIQERVGLHGRTFPCLKFRTMVINAEELKSELIHLNEMTGPVFKIKDDPRVTPVGRFLRSSSLDELPQLLNVWMGQMSIVGPRPPLPSEVTMYESWQRRRLSVRPGITCLWQISGRNHIDFTEWMTLDLQYIDQWTYTNDWLIILKTVPAVLFRHGAS